jgi:disulfide bond formation protein DsbB
MGSKVIFKYNISVRFLILASGIFSLLTLSGALIGQYVFLLHPCELCIYQRIPYALIALISLPSYFFVKSQKGLYYIAVFCSLLFLVDSGIAAYHTGVEYGFFPAPNACSGGGSEGQSLEEMRAAIMNAPLVSCAQAMSYIFGLSMAAWNMLAAFLAFVVSAVVLFKNRARL